MKALHLALLTSVVLSGPVMANPPSPSDEGYWWYNPAEKEPEVDKPEIPEVKALMAMAPTKLEKLIEDQMDYAVTVMTTDAAKDYWRLIDVSRRRSLAFTSLTNQVMLQNPELNVRAAYPISGPGRTAHVSMKQKERDTRLQQERQNYALAMFWQEDCAYCHAQRGVLNHFAKQYGWQLVKLDIDARPELVGEYGIEMTPVTIIIERNSKNWAPISVGADSLPNITSNAYQQIRILQGEINEQQAYTTESDDGQFFDPLAAPDGKTAFRGFGNTP